MYIYLFLPLLVSSRKNGGGSSWSTTTPEPT